MTLKTPEGMSADDVKRYVAAAAEGADIAEAGLMLCKRSQCAVLKRLSKRAGNVGDAVSVILECHDGRLDVDCASVLADWGAASAATAVFGPAGAAGYIFAKEVAVPILGKMLSALQEQTPAATAVMNDDSYERYPQEDGTMAYPYGSENSPYMCPQGYPAGAYGC